MSNVLHVGHDPSKRKRPSPSIQETQNTNRIGIRLNIVGADPSKNRDTVYSRKAAPKRRAAVNMPAMDTLVPVLAPFELEAAVVELVLAVVDALAAEAEAEALCAAEEATTDPAEGAATEAEGSAAEDTPAIWAWTVELKVPVAPETANMAEKACAGYILLAASLRFCEVTRMK